MYIYTASTSSRSRHMEYDCSVQMTFWCLRPEWCLRYILHIAFTAHVINEEVWSRIGQPPVTYLVKSRRIKLFGHIARAEPTQDHVCTLRVSISRLPEDWRHPWGRPRQSWLGTVEADLKRSTLASIQHVGVRPITFRMAECSGNSHAPWQTRHSMMMMISDNGIISMNY